jgi:hypothetical protein
MRRKVSTIIDESLFLRAKVEAAHQGRPWSALLEEALLQYLQKPGASADARPTVASAWGAVVVSPEVLRRVMDDEDGWLDA